MEFHLGVIALGAEFWLLFIVGVPFSLALAVRWLMAELTPGRRWGRTLLVCIVEVAVLMLGLHLLPTGTPIPVYLALPALPTALAYRWCMLVKSGDPPRYTWRPADVIRAILFVPLFPALQAAWLLTL